MANAVNRSIIKLPSLTSEHTQFIRPRKLVLDEPPLKLTIVHGRRQFPVCLKLAENENGDRISMRHLAEKITCETGLRPRDQKYYYKDLTWENPDMGPWSPALRDMGIKSEDNKVEDSWNSGNMKGRLYRLSDKALRFTRTMCVVVAWLLERFSIPANALNSVLRIHLVNFQKPYCDWHEISTLGDIEKENAACTKELHMLFFKLHGINEGFVDGNNQTMAFNTLKEKFETLKCTFLEQIQVLNTLNFDHRNAVGQARRRQLLDQIQRQIDQCTVVSNTIFHKFAQGHYLANVGRIFPRDIRTRPSFNKWAN